MYESYAMTGTWNYLGNVNNELDFTYGDGVTAAAGCGATLKGEFWYFGGYGSNNRQVSLTIINKQF